MCHHCGKEVRLGKVGSAKKDCGNNGMQQHLNRHHKDAMEEIKEARARSSAEAVGKVLDPRDESVRGTVMCVKFEQQSQASGERISPDMFNYLLALVFLQ